MCDTQTNAKIGSVCVGKAAHFHQTFKKMKKKKKIKLFRKFKT